MKEIEVGTGVSKRPVFKLDSIEKCCNESGSRAVEKSSGKDKNTRKGKKKAEDGLGNGKCFKIEMFVDICIEIQKKPELCTYPVRCLDVYGILEESGVSFLDNGIEVSADGEKLVEMIVPVHQKGMNGNDGNEQEK